MSWFIIKVMDDSFIFTSFCSKDEVLECGAQKKISIVFNLLFLVSVEFEALYGIVRFCRRASKKT